MIGMSKTFNFSKGKERGHTNVLQDWTTPRIVPTLFGTVNYSKEESQRTSSSIKTGGFLNALAPGVRRSSQTRVPRSSGSLPTACGRFIDEGKGNRDTNPPTDASGLTAVLKDDLGSSDSIDHGIG